MPLSDEFFDQSDSNNYYINGVSPYKDPFLKKMKIHGQPWLTPLQDIRGYYRHRIQS